MAKYRKKPVVIEAWKTDIELLELPPEARVLRDREPRVYDELHDTWVRFEYGDWIIRGVKGEFYPCKPDVFEATYEPAD